MEIPQSGIEFLPHWLRRASTTFRWPPSETVHSPTVRPEVVHLVNSFCHSASPRLRFRQASRALATQILSAEPSRRPCVGETPRDVYHPICTDYHWQYHSNRSCYSQLVIDNSRFSCCT